MSRSSLSPNPLGDIELRVHTGWSLAVPLIAYLCMRRVSVLLVYRGVFSLVTALGLSTLRTTLVRALAVDFTGGASQAIRFASIVGQLTAIDLTRVGKAPPERTRVGLAWTNS